MSCVFVKKKDNQTLSVNRDKLRNFWTSIDNVLFKHLAGPEAKFPFLFFIWLLWILGMGLGLGLGLVKNQQNSRAWQYKLVQTFPFSCPNYFGQSFSLMTLWLLTKVLEINVYPSWYHQTVTLKLNKIKVIIKNKVWNTYIFAHG